MRRITSSGPIVHKLSAVPRFSRAIRSATNPPPNVNGMQQASPMTKRKMISIGKFTLTAQRTVATRKTRFAMCMTGLRPYTSLRGERSSGPMAKPIIYTDTSSEDSAELVEWNSFIASGTPGAKIVDAMALYRRTSAHLRAVGKVNTTNTLKVIADTREIMIHLCRIVQLIGFLGSLGPSQSTRFVVSSACVDSS